MIADQNVSFKISLLQGSASGTLVYSETHLATTNDFGLVNLDVGNGSVVSGVFATITWESGPFFLKVEMDPSGGSNYHVMGVTQLLSVPYALYARRSYDGVGTGTSGQTLRHNGTSWIASSGLFNDGTNIGIGTSNPASKLEVVGPVFSAQLVSGSKAVYGTHSISGSYGWLGASNEGGYGYSPNGYDYGVKRPTVLVFMELPPVLVLPVILTGRLIFQEMLELAQLPLQQSSPLRLMPDPTLSFMMQMPVTTGREFSLRTITSIISEVMMARMNILVSIRLTETTGLMMLY